MQKGGKGEEVKAEGGITAGEESDKVAGTKEGKQKGKKKKKKKKKKIDR